MADRAKQNKLPRLRLVVVIEPANEYQQDLTKQLLDVMARTIKAGLCKNHKKNLVGWSVADGRRVYAKG